MTAITAIHHVAIICSDYPRSKTFYTQVLGFQVIEETYRAERQSYKLDLRVGDHAQLELFSFPSPPVRISRPEACGLRHIAFGVKNVEQYRDYILSHGMDPEPIRIDEITGKRFFFFTDPDALPIEIYEMD